MDGNLPYQQDLGVHDLAVVALRASTNRLEETARLMPEVLERLPGLSKGEVTFIG